MALLLNLLLVHLLIVFVGLGGGFLRHNLLLIDSCQVFTRVLVRGQSALALVVRVHQG